MLRQIVQRIVRPARVSLLQTAASSAHRRPKTVPVSSNHHITDRLAENRPLAAAEWAELRSALMATDTFITEVNVDATILGRCVPGAQLAVGKSYVAYLRERGIEPNLATVGKLLRLYHVSEAALTEADKEEIVNMYKRHIYMLS